MGGRGTGVLEQVGLPWTTLGEGESSLSPSQGVPAQPQGQTLYFRDMVEPRPGLGATLPRETWAHLCQVKKGPRARSPDHPRAVQRWPKGAGEGNSSLPFRPSEETASEGPVSPEPESPGQGTQG